MTAPPAMKTPIWHRLESAAAWVAVALASCAMAIGLVGPHLGGSDPGLQGRVGFAAETVAAMWVPGGMLTGAVALVALLRRRLWPAGVLAAVALVILGPELWARSWSPGAQATGGQRALRVATVNLCADNDEDPSMEACLRELDADVLVLVEFTSHWARQLEGWFVRDYPHRWLAAAPEDPERNTEGLRIAVWSRLPPAGEHEVLLLDQFNAQIRVPLRWQDRAFALYGIHPWKPYPYRLYALAWRERRQLLDWIRRERLPAVVAGDFNADPRSAFVRRLREFGLSNASEAVWGAAPVTWPMHRGALAAVRVAIDHVMHGEALTAVGFRTGMTTRSDHAPVLAELVWRDP